MVCTSCNQQLFGSEAFCPHCGKSTQQSQPYTPPPTAAQYAPPPTAAPYAPPLTATPYAPTKAKPGLRGFTKGWTIFTIVIYSAYLAQNLTKMNDAEINRLFLSIILVLAPALLSWLFTHKQIYYSKTKGVEREHEF